MALNYIAHFLEYLAAEKGASPLTLRTYGTDLRGWKNFVAPNVDDELFDPTKIAVNDTRAWVADMGRRGLKARTIMHKMSALSSFYEYMIRHHGATSNPVSRIHINRRERPLPRFIAFNELSAVINSYDDESAKPDADYDTILSDLVINILYQTGIRSSELVGLTDARVDTSRHELKVLGKRNKDRIVPFGDSLTYIINRYKAVRPARTADAGDKFVVDRNGRAITYSKVYVLVRRALDGRVSSPKRSPHVLRHTFATDMLNAGADLAAVRELLGHASLATTQIYTHVSLSEMRNAYRAAHPRAQVPDNRSKPTTSANALKTK